MSTEAELAGPKIEPKQKRRAKKPNRSKEGRIGKCEPEYRPMRIAAPKWTAGCLNGSPLFGPQ
jgi:hypothetical protein